MNNRTVLVAMGIVALLALLSITTILLKSIRKNPVDALRYE